MNSNSASLRSPLLGNAYLCVVCRHILRNPFQTGCGHRFCLDEHSSKVCSVEDVLCMLTSYSYVLSHPATFFSKEESVCPEDNEDIDLLKASIYLSRIVAVLLRTVEA